MSTGHCTVTRDPLLARKTWENGLPGLTEKEGIEGLVQPRYTGATRTSGNRGPNK